MLVNNDKKTIFADEKFSKFWKTTEKLECVDFIENPFFLYHNFNEQVDLALAGIPYGEGSLRKETKTGEFPDYLRKQSWNVRAYYDILEEGCSGVHDCDSGRRLFRGLKFVDMGNLDIQNGNEIGDSIREKTDGHLSPKVPIVAIGGDHSITYYLIEKACSTWNQPVTILIFDAHHDGKYNLSPIREINHANYVSMLLENEKVEKIIQVGVRGLRSISNCIFNKKLIQISPARLQDYAAILSGMERKNIYLSIDLDVLDTAEYPNVDYPIPGGLTINQIQSCLELLKNQKPNLIGADLVEGLPDDRNGSGMAALKALSLILDCMCKEKVESR